jgi:hypothetical protein
MLSFTEKFVPTVLRVCAAEGNTQESSTPAVGRDLRQAIVPVGLGGYCPDKIRRLMIAAIWLAVGIGQVGRSMFASGT